MLLSSQVARSILANSSIQAMDVESENSEPIVCHSELFGRLGPPEEAAASFPEPKIDGLNRRSAVVDYLPNETLSAVFNEGRRVITAREGSWLISVSRVSRRWRDIALHTPFLWNSIYYGPRLRSLGYTQACLERSQNCPLDITLQFEDGDHLWRDWDDAAHRLGCYLDLIAPHINRWRTLDVHIHCHKSLPELLDRLPSQAAILKHVRIVLENEVLNNERHNHEMFGLGAPMLASVELRGISFASCKLPLAQITSLTLTRSSKALSPGEFRKVLTGPPYLRELSLLGDVVSTGRDAWLSINIPSLLSLTLSPGADTSFTHLCNALIMPALESLTFQHFSSESIRIFIESLRPYSPKYPSLRLLELRIVGFTPTSMTAQIVGLLEEFPMINQLSLISLDPSAYISLLECLICEPKVRSTPKAPTGDPHVGHDGNIDTPFGFSADAVDTMLDSVVQASDSPELAKRVLLPHLRTIAITPMNEDNIADICKLISTRQETGRTILCLKASAYDRISLDRFQWLREHVALDSI